MAELHPSIAEFISDKDGSYSEAKILSTIRQLQREGRKDRSIARALLATLISFSSEMSVHDDYSFMLRSRQAFDNCIEGMEKE